MCLHLRLVVVNQGEFALQGTSGNVWRDFCVSHGGGWVGTGI